MARTGEWIGAGWRMVTAPKVFWPFVLTALVVMVVTSVINGLSVLLGGPISAAVYLIILHLMKAGRFDANRAQEVMPSFVDTMMVGLLTTVFIAVGLVLCIVPGVILAAMYHFPLLLVIDRKMSFWDAMEASRLRVQQDLGGFVVFFLALAGINLLGALALGVGLLVSIPVTWCATAIAYRELWPEQTTAVVHETPPSPPVA